MSEQLRFFPDESNTQPKVDDKKKNQIIEKEEDVLSDFDSEFKIESQEEFSLCDGAEYPKILLPAHRRYHGRSSCTGLHSNRNQKPQ